MSCPVSSRHVFASTMSGLYVFKASGWNKWNVHKGNWRKDNRSWSQHPNGDWFVRKSRGTKHAGGASKRKQRETARASAGSASSSGH